MATTCKTLAQEQASPVPINSIVSCGVLMHVHDLVVGASIDSALGMEFEYGIKERSKRSKPH